MSWIEEHLCKRPTEELSHAELFLTFPTAMAERPVVVFHLLFGSFRDPMMYQPPALAQAVHVGDEGLIEHNVPMCRAILIQRLTKAGTDS